jgi:hypothetical protein
MHRLIAVASITAALVGSMLSPAHADAPSAAGFTCSYTSSDDSSGAVGGRGQQIGVIDGGPVLVADIASVDDATTPPTVWIDPSGNPASGTITCAIQVGGTGAYTDADAAAASASGTTVVDLPPTEITYYSASTDNIWMCTTWTLTDAHGDSETLYLDDTTGDFTTDPASAKCALAISADDGHTSHAPSRFAVVWHR